MPSFLRTGLVSDLSPEWRNDKKPRNDGKAKNPTIPQWQSGKKLSAYDRRKAKNRSDNEMQNRMRSRTSKEPKNFNSSLQLCLQKIILIRSQYDKKLKFLGSNRKLKGLRFFVGSFLRSFFALVFCGSFRAVRYFGFKGGRGDFGSFGSFGMGDKKPR